MNKLCAFALTAGLVALAPSSAFAAWDYIGSISVQYGRDRDVAYSDFGGPVERLRFKADRNDVYCRSVRATFSNGRTRDLFSGRLNEDRARVVDLPGDARNIRRLDFRCGTGAGSGARIDIAADITRYRDNWRRSPSWRSRWNDWFDWNRDRWVSLGSERFTGRLDRETSFTGIRGRSVSSIAMRPVDSDARCARVIAHFANGRSRAINVDWGDRLREDRMYRFDLPGRERNVTRIDMACRPVGDRSVTIRIYAAK
jgi:hypothetical protein